MEMRNRDDQPPLAIREPLNGEVIVVNPDEAYRKECLLICDVNGKYILISDAIAPQILDEFKGNEFLEPSIIFVTCNASQELFLWPVRKPIADDHPVWEAMDGWLSINRVMH